MAPQGQNHTDYATMKDIEISEKRLQKYVDLKIEYVSKDVQANKESIEVMFSQICSKLDPIAKMYENAGTFGKWVKAALIFFSLVFGFFLTFKQFLAQIFHLIFR